MFEMFLNSARLFLRGKLFKDFGQVLRQWLIGFVVAVAATVALAVFVNPWVGAVVGGLLGGALVPYLFKDLKYA